MTVVVGFTTPRYAAVVADRNASNGRDHVLRDDPKIVLIGKPPTIAIGFTGSYLYGQLIASFDWQRIDFNQPAHVISKRLLTGQDSFWKYLDEHKFFHIESRKKIYITLIVTNDGQILMIDEDFHVGKPSFHIVLGPQPFEVGCFAIGSGAFVALGATRAFLQQIEQYVEDAGLEKSFVCTVCEHVVKITADYVDGISREYHYVIFEKETGKMVDSNLIDEQTN